MNRIGLALLLLLTSPPLRADEAEQAQKEFDTAEPDPELARLAREKKEGCVFANVVLGTPLRRYKKCPWRQGNLFVKAGYVAIDPVCWYPLKVLQINKNVPTRVQFLVPDGEGRRLDGVIHKGVIVEIQVGLVEDHSKEYIQTLGKPGWTSEGAQMLWKKSGYRVYYSMKRNPQPGEITLWLTAESYQRMLDAQK